MSTVNPLYKSGVTTSEFWVSMLPQLFAMLVLFHVVTAEDATTLEGALTKIMEALVSLGTSGMVVWKYIESRVRTKEAVLAHETAKTTTVVVDGPTTLKTTTVVVDGAQATTQATQV